MPNLTVRIRDFQNQLLDPLTLNAETAIEDNLETLIQHVRVNAQDGGNPDALPDGQTPVRFANIDGEKITNEWLQKQKPTAGQGDVEITLHLDKRFKRKVTLSEDDREVLDYCYDQEYKVDDERYKEWSDDDGSVYAFEFCFTFNDRNALEDEDIQKKAKEYLRLRKISKRNASRLEQSYETRRQKYNNGLLKTSAINDIIYSIMIGTQAPDANPPDLAILGAVMNGCKVKVSGTKAGDTIRWVTRSANGNETVRQEKPQKYFRIPLRIGADLELVAVVVGDDNESAPVRIQIRDRFPPIDVYQLNKYMRKFLYRFLKSAAKMCIHRNRQDKKKVGALHLKDVRSAMRTFSVDVLCDIFPPVVEAPPVDLNNDINPIPIENFSEVDDRFNKRRQYENLLRCVSYVLKKKIVQEMIAHATKGVVSGVSKEALNTLYYILSSFIMYMLEARNVEATYEERYNQLARDLNAFKTYGTARREDFRANLDGFDDDRSVDMTGVSFPLLSS